MSRRGREMRAGERNDKTMICEWAAGLKCLRLKR